MILTERYGSVSKYQIVRISNISDKELIKGLEMIS